MPCRDSLPGLGDAQLVVEGGVDPFGLVAEGGYVCWNDYGAVRRLDPTTGDIERVTLLERPATLAFISAQPGLAFYRSFRSLAPGSSSELGSAIRVKALPVPRRPGLVTRGVYDAVDPPPGRNQGACVLQFLSRKVKSLAKTEVQHLMSQPAVTCRLGETLNLAAQRMWEHDCGAVPVVDHDGRAVAMITDRDIAMAAYTQGKPLHEIFVDAATSTELCCCHPEDSLTTVESLMRDKQVRRVPVVDAEGKPMGVLSLGDVARLGSARSKKRRRLAREVTETLAAICAPRPPAMQG